MVDKNVYHRRTWRTRVQPAGISAICSTCQRRNASCRSFRRWLIGLRTIPPPCSCWPSCFCCIFLAAYSRHSGSLVHKWSLCSFRSVSLGLTSSGIPTLTTRWYILRLLERSSNQIYQEIIRRTMGKSFSKFALSFFKGRVKKENEQCVT